MAAPRLSAIVLAYNNPGLTDRCLASLASGWPSDWELILADNGSTDGTSAVGDRYRDRVPRLQVLRMATNRPFSEAVNDAARHAHGSVLVFLNNDIEVTPPALEVLAHPLDRLPEGGVVGAKLVYPGGERVQHAGVRPMLWGLVSNFAVGASPDDPRVSVEREMFAVTGACVAVTRRLFDDLGGFDTGFHWGYEDIDLCLRARARGGRVVYVPSATAVHAESVTLGHHHYDATREVNHRRYRERWDAELIPMESRYLAGLRDSRIRTVAVVGTGAAGRSLAGVLSRQGFEVTCFAESTPHATTCEGRPIVSIAELAGHRVDAVIAGTQFFVELEAALHAAMPTTRVLFPAVD